MKSKNLKDVRKLQNEKTEDTFQRADEALYNAKEKGRNQVIIKI